MSASCLFTLRPLQRKFAIGGSCSRLETVFSRSYLSRAHPVPTPVFSPLDAIKVLLESAEERKKNRENRWEKFREIRTERRKRQGDASEEGPYRNQDETVSVALNLNLDPRKPNQAIRGQFPLPHGTGNTVRVAVFSNSPSVVENALAQGAAVAGGEDLIKEMAKGEKLDTFDRTLATPDVMPSLGKSLARILGPRGLMPNPKMGNIVDEMLVTSEIKKQLAGMVKYRTDKFGLIHAPLGKASFGEQKLLDNLRVFLQGIADAEPELDKKAQKQRKGGKGGKFILKAHLNATQGKSVRMDVRSVDASSPFFMTELPP